MTIPMLKSFGPLAEKYDAFILDLWGVIHDGFEAYPGAAATLAKLKETGKKTLLLSNAPRRSHALVATMEKMGIPRDHYDFVLSSGEAVYEELKSRRDPFYAALGKRLYHLGPERDVNVFAGLDYEPVSSPEQADFIVNTGPVELWEKLDAYKPLLDACAKRKLPMVCANPDHLVIRQGEKVMCAGELAAYYQGLGCPVSQRGKPDPAIYDLAVEMLGSPPRDKILAVGDALETDIKGATGADIPSALVTGGIHAEALGVRYGEMADGERVADLAAAFGQKPVAALPAFGW